eukprot:6415489-Amphidinium_carterae.1
MTWSPKLLQAAKGSRCSAKQQTAWLGMPVWFLQLTIKMDQKSKITSEAAASMLTGQEQKKLPGYRRPHSKH